VLQVFPVLGSGQTPARVRHGCDFNKLATSFRMMLVAGRPLATAAIMRVSRLPRGARMVPGFPKGRFNVTKKKTATAAEIAAAEWWAKNEATAADFHQWCEANDIVCATKDRPAIDAEDMAEIRRRLKPRSKWARRALEVAAIKGRPPTITQKPAPAKPRAVFDAPTGKLVLDGKPLSLSAGEKYVLEKLVAMRTATLPDLQSQHPRPDKVLKGLVKKYPKLKNFISLPGGPGRGGYSTTIEPGKPE
jgi:hypothetical protein